MAEKTTPQVGMLTAGADMLTVIGTSAGVMVWNKAQRVNGSDILWAIGELLIGWLVSSGVSASGSPVLRNISLGVGVGGATYLVERLIP